MNVRGEYNVADSSGPTIQVYFSHSSHLTNRPGSEKYRRVLTNTTINVIPVLPEAWNINNMQSSGRL